MQCTNGRDQRNALWGRHKRALLCCLALLIFATAPLYAGYQMLTGEKHGDTQASHAVPAVLEPPGRMLVILIDSARQDFVFSDRMPLLAGLCQRGAWGISEVVSVPITIAGSQAIFSGTVANPLTIFEDFEASTSTADNLFRRVTQRGGRAVTFGALLRGAYGKYTDLAAFQPKNFLYSQYRDDTEHIFKQSYRFLKEETWDLAVVTFYALDWLGHLETPRSPNYPSTLQLLDEYVAALVGLTTEHDVVLITSEHGMDDHGFHMDRTPIVIETPFILLGPHVNRGGPKRVLQIDWAPTLSILAGVSPLYASPALPALDLLTLSAADNAMLLRQFSRLITGTATAVTLDELRARRLTALGRQGSPLPGVCIVVTTILSLMLLAYVAVDDSDHREPGRCTIMRLAGAGLGLGGLLGIAWYVGLVDYVSNNLLFSANFILHHELSVLMAIVCMAMLPSLYVRLFGHSDTHTGAVALWCVLTVILTGVLLSAQPYHLLNWLVVSLPIIAWGMTRRATWLVIFSALCVGFLIRRLTFYNVYVPITLPPRWLVTVAVLVMSFAWLWWRLQADHRRWYTLGLGTLCFLPGIMVIAWPANVALHVVLLLVCLLPVAWLSMYASHAKDVWLALWVTFFYLGTSSNIYHMTHIVAFPLFIAFWLESKSMSSCMKGIMVSLVIWILYLIPGNSFDVKIIELRDEFIVSLTSDKHIEHTVMVIVSRYILPAAVLIWGMQWTTRHVSLFSMLAASLLPGVCVIGIKLALLVSTTSSGLPWEPVVQLAVCLGHLAVLLGGFLLVGVVAQAGKLLMPRAAAAVT